MNQLRRGALVLRGLPTRLRGRIAWRRAGQLVVERGRALVPVAQRAVTGMGKGLDRSATELGRSAAAGSRGLRSLSHQFVLGVRRLAPVGRRGFARFGHACRVGASAVARLSHRLGADGARLVGHLLARLWERRAVLLAIALRGAWWAALALLWFGGRSVLDLHAPLAEDALPLFFIGLALCLPLFFAAAARLRWAGFALGAGHAALAVLVWTITTSG